MNSSRRKKFKLILSIITLLVLIIISVLFFLNNPKDKKLINYANDLLDIDMNRYVISTKGSIKPDKYNVKHSHFLPLSQIL